MAAQFSMDVERGLVTVAFSGDLVAHDIAEYLLGLRSSSEFQNTFSELVDLSGVGSSSLSSNDLENLAAT